VDDSRSSHAVRTDLIDSDERVLLIAAGRGSVVELGVRPRPGAVRLILTDRRSLLVANPPVSITHSRLRCIVLAPVRSGPVRLRLGIAFTVTPDGSTTRIEWMPRRPGNAAIVAHSIVTAAAAHRLRTGLADTSADDLQSLDAIVRGEFSTRWRGGGEWRFPRNY